MDGAATVDRAGLARRLADLALLRGTFTLRSGRTSPYYLDKYLFSTRPDVLRDLGRLFAERIRATEREVGRPVARLAGAELGGIPLVTAASLETGLPCVFVRNARKAYGTGRQLEGRLERGEGVVLLEDVATTGGQALEAVKVLREAGADVLAVIAAIAPPPPPSRYAPGTRVRVTQQVPRLPAGGGPMKTTVEGVIVRYGQQKTGSWYAHAKDDKLWLDRLELRLDDGELAVLNLDQYSRVEIVA
jgi:orotate phosphoribosyltransferase